MASRKLRLVRVIMLGDPNVGKTSVLARFVQGKWRPGYRATLGADFFTKEMSITTGGVEQVVTLQLWDTAGMERCMSAMGPAFFRGADAVCLCFDITERRSFENLESWRQLFFQHSRTADPQQVPMLVLGNKADLDEQRQVRAEEARRWCRERGNLQYLEVSAKDDVNVATAMRAAATTVLDGLAREEPAPEIPVVPVLVLGRRAEPADGPCAC